MSDRKIYSIIEATEVTGVDRETIVAFIEREWITPTAREDFDDEDLARINLIRELRDQFGANDEAVPLILHLLDQLFYLRSKLSNLKGERHG